MASESRQTVHDEIPTRECFVALFDILGFGNMVKANKLGNVFNTYLNVQHDFKNRFEHINKLAKGFAWQGTISFRTFSDTFLLYTSGTDDLDFKAILSACDFLFIGANENGIPIRGAITRGELIASEHIEIGKAIVDAYEMEQMQDWIGCWISDICIPNINMAEYAGDIVEYPIPLKDNRAGTQLAFNWIVSIISKLMYVNKSFTVGQVKSEITFTRKKSDDLSIRKKQDNTDKFIDFALSRTILARYKFP
jgi:hypothetical protein